MPTPQQDPKQVDAILAAAKTIVTAVQSLDPAIRQRALKVAEMLMSEGRPPFLTPTQPQTK